MKYCPICGEIAHEMRQCPAHASLPVCTKHCKEECNSYDRENFLCRFKVLKPKFTEEEIDTRLFVIKKNLAKLSGMQIYYRRQGNAQEAERIGYDIMKLIEERNKLNYEEKTL